MIRNYTLLFVFAAAVVLFGCTRKNDVKTPPPAPIAGKGGNIKIQVTPEHHGNSSTIVDGLVYVKYNAAAKPHDSVAYDDVRQVVLIDNKPLAIFDSLTQGTYYFYATGVDTDPKVMDTVIGGGVFVVPDTNTNTYNLRLNVSEVGGH